MARRTPEDSEKTRQALLDVALRLYAEQGLHQVSLKTIAAEAGVTHGALYWHFKNRDDLILSLADAYTLPFEDAYINNLQAIDQDPLAALKEFLLQVARQIVSQPQQAAYYRVFYQRSSELPELPALKTRLDEAFSGWCEQIDKFVKQARKQKLVGKKTKSQPVAELLLSQLFGMLDTAHYPLGETQPLELAELGITKLVKGLQATGGKTADK